MRNPIPILPTLSPLLLLAACDVTPADDAGANAAAAMASETNIAADALSSRPTPQAAPPAPAASAFEAETPDYQFSYSYPAAAAAIPALNAWLESDRKKTRAELARDAAGYHREATRDGFPFRQYSHTSEWMVVTETPRLLSLSNQFNVYTGGAHGSPGFEALVWDKQASRRLLPIDMFQSPAALQKAVGARFCDLLDAERTKRRGEPVVRNNGDTFNECIPITDATLILGSSNRRAIDRLGFLIGPYSAGSYAEGTYDLTIPVNAAVLATVKPQWREAFAAR